MSTWQAKQAEWRAKIHEWRNKFNDWWEPLAPREKQVVIIGSIIVGLLILYYLIWSPYLNHMNNLRENIVSQEKNLAWMQTANNEIDRIAGQDSNKNKITSPVALLGLLQQQINQAGLSTQLTQLKQASDDSVEMHFQKVSFDALMKMLITAIKGQAITINQVAVVASDTPGIVDADIRLGLSH